ncbi:hypothetical protein HQ576_21055 [bacterium]|nr:hypothetical protein [bacterium]
MESSRGGGLFDLANDVGEARDLSKERPEVLRRVRERFAAWAKAMAQAEPRGPFKNF